MSATWGQCCLDIWPCGAAMSPEKQKMQNDLRIVVHRSLQHHMALFYLCRLVRVDWHMYVHDDIGPHQYQIYAMFEQSVLDLSVLLVFQHSCYWDKLECLQYVIKIDIHPNKSMISVTELLFKPKLSSWLFFTIKFPNIYLYQEIKDTVEVIMKEKNTLPPRAGRQT